MGKLSVLEASQFYFKDNRNVMLQIFWTKELWYNFPWIEFYICFEKVDFLEHLVVGFLWSLVTLGSKLLAVRVLKRYHMDFHEYVYLIVQFSDNLSSKQSSFIITVWFYRFITSITAISFLISQCLSDWILNWNNSSSVWQVNWKAFNSIILKSVFLIVYTNVLVLCLLHHF